MESYTIGGKEVRRYKDSNVGCAADGTFYDVFTNKERPIKLCEGSPVCTVKMQGKYKVLSARNIMASLWMENYDPLMYVIAIDGNKLNLNITNLKLSTNSNGGEIKQYARKLDEDREAFYANIRKQRAERIAKENARSNAKAEKMKAEAERLNARYEADKSRMKENQRLIRENERKLKKARERAEEMERIEREASFIRDARRKMDSKRMANYRSKQYKKTSAPDIWCSRDGVFLQKGLEVDLYANPLDDDTRNVKIYANGKYYSARKLVYETWCGLIGSDEYIICKDGNKRNLRADNLIKVNREEYMKDTLSHRAGANETFQYLATMKSELELAIYYATTGEWDRYHQYVEDTAYPELVKFGLNTIGKDKKWCLEAAKATIGLLYSNIAKNRGHVSVIQWCKKRMKFYGVEGWEIDRESLLKSVEHPVDDVNFQKLAMKYGLI